MGDVTSGGVQDDAAANADISGGGGDTSPSTPASLGFGGARGDIVARDTTPAPNVQPSRIAFNNQPISGQGPVNTFSRYLQTFTEPVTDFFTGGAQTDDRGPSGADVGAVSVDDNQFNQGLASLTGTRDASPMSDFPSYMSSPRADTDTDTTMAALRRGAPALIASNQRDVDQGMMMETRPNLFPQELGGGTIASPPRSGFQNIIDPIRTSPIDFVFDYGFGTAGSPQSPEDFRREEEKIASMTGGARNIIYPLQNPTLGEGALTQAALPAARPAVIDTQPKTDANAAAARIASLLQSGKKGTQQEEAQKKTIGQRLQEIGKKISDFTFSDLVNYIGGVLRGDSNFKGTPSSAIDPFARQGMGPGPFVGGGVPSPSGGGGGMAMPAKDPCPPGFRFDPTLQQCVPIIAPNTPTDTTTTPTTPTTPAPGTSPPAAGGIANAYPFVLTPPIGTPVGNLPPVRLTT